MNKPILRRLNKPTGGIVAHHILLIPIVFLRSLRLEIAIFFDKRNLCILEIHTCLEFIENIADYQEPAKYNQTVVNLVKSVVHINLLQSLDVQQVDHAG